MQMPLMSVGTVRNDIMSHYQSMRQSIKTALATAPGGICFTQDLWTSPQNLSFMCITAHWIDCKWGLRNLVLDFVNVTGSHTGEAIAQAFLKIVEEWGLCGRVFALTCDNATNNNAAISIIAATDSMFTESNHYRCFAHVLNLAVQQLLNGECSRPYA